MYPRPLRPGRARRFAFTLIEMLMAVAVTGILTLALGVLASTVGDSHQVVQERSQAVQHARVVIDRIERTLGEAHASEPFPGFIVLAESVGGYSFPHTLVVWRPDGTPADPEGLPRFNEIVVYRPNPASPNEIWELKAPSDTRPVPAATNAALWQTELAALATNAAASRVVLTDLLRQGEVSTSVLGALRFETQYRPTLAEWQQYRAGSLTWNNLNWAQNRYGSSLGMAYAWCSMELQLVPEPDLKPNDSRQLETLPFFGSGVVAYELKK